MFAAQGQAQAFLATVYAGLAAGAAYDLLRLLRLFAGAGQVLTGILDFVFWAVAAVLVAVAAALAGAQGLRFFLVLGTACGMLLWAVGLRRVMLGAGRCVINAARRVSRLSSKDGPGNGAEAGKGTDGGE